jgi:hypothetical protein
MEFGPVVMKKCTPMHRTELTARPFWTRKLSFGQQYDPPQVIVPLYLQVMRNLKGEFRKGNPKKIIWTMLRREWPIYPSTASLVTYVLGTKTP